MVSGRRLAERSPLTTTASTSSDRIDPTADGKRAVFIGCVDRLTALIERENAALLSGGAVDLEDFNARKTHALLEFSRASRAFRVPRSEPAEERLATLRDALMLNGHLLSQRLRAMKEIADLMIYTLAAAESDGTYTTRMHLAR
jgi:hypothetical protein